MELFIGFITALIMLFLSQLDWSAAGLGWSVGELKTMREVYLCTKCKVWHTWDDIYEDEKIGLICYYCERGDTPDREKICGECDTQGVGISRSGSYCLKCEDFIVECRKCEKNILHKKSFYTRHIGSYQRAYYDSNCDKCTKKYKLISFRKIYFPYYCEDNSKYAQIKSRLIRFFRIKIHCCGAWYPIFNKETEV
jgi:hypothetical protein